MGRNLIIGDIHNKIDTARKIFLHWKDKVDTIFFLGDYFDSWNDNATMAENTAKFLRWLLDNHADKARLIFGNHDTTYAAPQGGPDKGCFGHSKDKHAAVKKHLNLTHWARFELFYLVDGWYLSHAGITKHHFEHPIHGLTHEQIDIRCKQAKQAALDGLHHPLLTIGASRGGFQPIGGITWADWHEDFEPVPGIKQIVGHTPVNKPQSKNAYGTDSGESWNLDCLKNRFVGLLTDGKFSWHFAFDVKLTKQLQKETK